MKTTQHKIVILGANGFVGSHLVNSLAQLPDTKVVCFDRFSRPQSFKSAPNVQKVVGDFFNNETTDEVLENVDYLFHCFSATTPHTSDNDPYTDINTLARSVEIFERCIENGVKKIVFISSGGAVYGNVSEESLATEETTPMPISPYGICKLAVEHYLGYFKKKHDTPYIIYRLTNPYGPGQTFKNNQGVIPAFLSKIKSNEEITIYGDGNSSRDFIYIDDAVKMITETFMRDNAYPVYNIGSGLQTKLNDIIKTLRELLHNEEIRVTYEEAPSTFLRKTSVSIDRFSSEFGKPKLTKLVTGISETIKSNNL